MTIASKKKTCQAKNNKEIICFFDYETRSEVDIAVMGAAVYAAHPSTEVIILGYKFSNRKTVKFWWPGQPIPKDLKNHKGPLVAHNYKFEHHITVNVMKKLLPAHWKNLKNYRCTAATAARVGLPGKLHLLSNILKCKNAKKTDIGRKLILKYSVPKKRRKTGELYFNEITPEDWELWKEYNTSDILAMEEIYNRLPKLHEDPFEGKIFELDKRMEFDGVQIDLKNVNKLIKAYESYVEQVSETAEKLAGLTKSGGLVVNSSTAFRDWLNDLLLVSEQIENVQAFTLEQLVISLEKTRKNQRKNKILLAIKCRQFLAGAAVKKLYRYRDMTLTNGNYKDPLAYYGATPTGRHAGRGVQLHNVIRKSSKQFTKDVKNLINAEIPFEEAGEALKLLLRQMIIAGKGNKFIIGDFGAIEARVLFWLAGCQRGLNAFQKNLDIYKDLATEIYSVAYKSIDDQQRSIGKQGILGLGYGMGHERFIDTCWTKGGIRILTGLANKVIRTYRATYPEIPAFWRAAERHFSMALNQKNIPVILHMTGSLVQVQFLYSGNSMKVTLPSGRIMYYFLPGATSGGKIKYIHPRKKISFMWGGVVVENLVQAVARDLMVEAMLKCDKTPNLKPVLTVHDEIINQVPATKAKTGLKLFEKIMTTAPSWAPGLPMAAECVIRGRYEKI
jgi:DNA polymerase